MDPTPEEAAEGSILVKVLATVLERLVNTNTATAITDPGQVTKFHALKAPGICVEAYLDRIHKYASCSNECFILALIYIDRLIERNNFLLTELNVHRVVITAILLAAKFFDDAYYNNAYYAKVGGVLLSELNGLEVDFLFRTNFSLHVQPEVFEKYKAELMAHSINSGLIPPHLASSIATSHPLPNIPEMEPGSSNSSMTGSVSATATQSEYAQQQQQPSIQLATTAGVPSYDSIMSARPQVTSCPSDSSQYTSGIVNANRDDCGPTMQTTSYTVEATIQAPVLQPLSEFHPMTAATNSTAFQVSTEPDIQYQHQQSLLLQRANSLPPFSSARCVEHAFIKLPYSTPAMPTTAPHMNVDQVHYQMMMSQLFPIENTLVHHNHHQGTRSTITASNNISNHHANPTGGLVGHHPGGGLGPMAYEIAWSG